MFESITNKIKNLFTSKRHKTVSSKGLGGIANDINTIQRYKNLIPNLLDEFIKPNMIEHKRSNSLEVKKSKLSLENHKLIHSNSVLLFKLKKKSSKKINIRSSIGRHYFMGSTERSTKKMTSKDVRRGSYYMIKENIILEKEDDDTDNVQSKIKVPIKRKPRRKRTIDPQDTLETNNMQFFIGNEETKEKLEEYQEKMRKTQLRYYVFKKITSYKTALRRCFHVYRSKVQLIGALDEKEEENKENNIEISKIKSKLLKHILKNRAFKEQKELNKYLLRYYYNCKYLASISNMKDNLPAIDVDDVNKNDSNINSIKEEDKKEEDKQEEDKKEEDKKEEDKKELTQEEIEKAQRKRNKELRDLFYNKVRERKKWLHDHFVRFYYKGLLWAMKTGNIRNNTSSTGENTTSDTNQSNQTNQTDQTNSVNSHSTENSLINKTSSEIDTININKEIEKKDEEQKKEEPKKEDDEKKEKKNQAKKMRERSKGLRKLLSERNKEKTNILRKYFFKFLSNGILLSLKKTTMQSTKSLTVVEVPENGEKGQDEENKEEEGEKNWIIEEKKRRRKEEEQKQKELWEKKIKMILKIFNKKDQIQCGKQRTCLQKWNLRAKIIAIGDLTNDYRKPRRTKGKKKKKKVGDKNDGKKEEKEEKVEQ